MNRLTNTKRICREKYILLECDHLGKNIAKTNAKILPRQMQKINILPRQKSRQLSTAEVNFAGWLLKHWAKNIKRKGSTAQPTKNDKYVVLLKHGGNVNFNDSRRKGFTTHKEKVREDDS